MGYNGVCYKKVGSVSMKKNNSINFTSEQDRLNYLFQKCMENYDDPSITFVEHIGYVRVVTDKETSCEIFQGKTYMPKIEAQHNKVAEIRELKKIEGITVKHSRIKLNLDNLKIKKKNHTSKDSTNISLYEKRATFIVNDPAMMINKLLQADIIRGNPYYSQIINSEFVHNISKYFFTNYFNQEYFDKMLNLEGGINRNKYVWFTNVFITNEHIAVGFLRPSVKLKFTDTDGPVPCDTDQQIGLMMAVMDDIMNLLFRRYGVLICTWMKQAENDNSTEYKLYMYVKKSREGENDND